MSRDLTGWAPRARRTWTALFVALLVVVGVTVTLNVLGTRRTAPAPRTGQEVLAATLYAKLSVAGQSAFLAAPPGLGESADPAALAISNMEEAAKKENLPERARALRRLAILRSLHGRPGVDEALSRLDGLSPKDREPAPLDEVEILRAVLVEQPAAGDVPRLAEQIATVKMGWFDHLLRERLYRRAGQGGQADEALAAARNSALGTVAVLMVFGGALSLGAIAWLILLLWPGKREVLAKIARGLSDRGELGSGQSIALLATFLAYMVLTFGLWLVARSLPFMRGASLGWQTALVLGVQSTIVLATWLVYRLLGRRAGATMETLGFRFTQVGRSVLVGFIGYLLLLPAIVVVLLPLAALFEKLGIPSESHPIVDQIRSGTEQPLVLVALFVVAAVLAPLLEEALFRGALYGSLKSRMGGRWAMFLGAFIFAIIHPQVGLGLVGVFVIGLVLTLAYEYTGSLVASTVVHALNNGLLLAVAVALFGG